MKSKRICYFLSLALVLAFGPLGGLSAASQLTLSSSGTGTFVLQGAALEKVASLDLTLTYDAGAWANPRVSQGALTTGALMAVNISSPGTIRIGIISTRPIQGDGPVATVSFTARGNTSGGQFGLDARLTNLDGTPLPVNVRVVNPPNPGTGGPNQPALVEESPAEVSPSPRGRTGMILAPNLDGQAGTGSGSGIPGPSSPGYGYSGDPGSPPAKTDKSTDRTERKSPVNSEREIQDLTSILERFKEYSGDRRPQDFIALFDLEGTGRLRQNPPIALADGETPVEVVIFSESGHDHSMDLAVMGADLVSVEEDPGDSRSLVLKLLPVKGVYEASLALPLDNLMVVLPLVVAPRLNVDLDNSGTVTESDFSLFLEKGSSFDLNGDGKQDYLDDYLFTANYLAVINTKKATGPGSRAGQSEAGHTVSGPTRNGLAATGT